MLDVRCPNGHRGNDCSFEFTRSKNNRNTLEETKNV